MIKNTSELEFKHFVIKNWNNCLYLHDNNKDLLFKIRQFGLISLPRNKEKIIRYEDNLEISDSMLANIA
jgi:hypothetical protein